MVTAVHHMVGAAEIQEMFGGVSRQRIQQIIGRDDFPDPAMVFKMGKAWLRADVEQWAVEHGRVLAAETDEQPRVAKGRRDGG